MFATFHDRGAHRRRLAACAMAVGAVVLAACTLPAVPGPPPTTSPPSDEPFTVVLIGDSEQRMRGNTDAEVAAYVQAIADHRSTTEVYFDHEGGQHRVDPEIVLLAGDISADRDTGVVQDMPIWQPLYEAGIGFIAGFGNHDWDPAHWPDGPGYSVAGHLSNESTTAFTRETYLRTAALTGDFTYTEVGPSSAHGPVAFHARYKGVEIVNFNTFLYQPSYFYPDGWPLSCNLINGGAGCQVFVSAEPQIERMQDLLGPQDTSTALFLQHYPLSTQDLWWSDHDASGTTTGQRKDRLLDLMSAYDHATLLAGHNHSELRTNHVHNGSTIAELVAPYFGGDGGDDPLQGGRFLALLVSPTEGILEVRTLPAT